MRPKGSPQQLFQRRCDAVLQVVDRKRKQRDVAAEFKIHPATLCSWVKMYRLGGGAQALQVKSPPGRPAGLDEAQVRDVVACILRGARACGFDTDLWTLPRVGRLIQKRHGVKYDRDHLSRLVRSWGLSWQKPATRPIERNQQTIDHWLRHDWPRIKKKSAG
jgi:transposase